MTTWIQLRDTVIRPLLKDTAMLTDPTKKNKWSDGELLVYANYGIDDLSRYVPTYKTSALAADNSTKTFSLPTDLVVINSVRIGDSFVEEIKPVTGHALGLPTSGQAYLIEWPEEGQITFVRAPVSLITIGYTAYRDRLTDETSILPMGRYRWMEQALVFYCCYLANMREGISRANLEQWASKMQLNVGNPLTLEGRAWLDQYDRLVRENR